MTYKTKIREVKLPGNAEELKAIGADVNSLRSIGMAIYRQLRETYLTDASVAAAVERIFEASASVVHACEDDPKGWHMLTSERNMLCKV